MLAAGEMWFDVEGVPEVTDVSNQSTGYCPETSCWPAVERALHKAGIAHPGRLTMPFVFRLCEHCRTRNLVKDDDWTCAVCEHTLPEQWNFG